MKLKEHNQDYLISRCQKSWILMQNSIKDLLPNNQDESVLNSCLMHLASALINLQLYKQQLQEPTLIFSEGTFYIGEMRSFIEADEEKEFTPITKIAEAQLDKGLYHIIYDNAEGKATYYALRPVPWDRKELLYLISIFRILKFCKSLSRV